METGAPNLKVLWQALQAISNKIEVNPLLAAIMRVSIENTGAQRGFLLLKNNGCWRVAVKGEASAAGVEISMPACADEIGQVPLELIQLVSCTNQWVVVEDAASQGVIANRPPIRPGKTGSLLGAPLSGQGGLTGLVYLEESQTPGIFTPEKVQLLELVLSQAAISLENTRKYEALRESELSYRRIVDTAHEGIWVLGPDAETTFVNARMAEVLGYRPDELLARPMSAFVDAVDLDDHSRKMEARRQGRSESYERCFRSKDGQIVWAQVSATSLFDDEHRFKGSFALVTDITERKRTEQRIELLNFALDKVHEAALLIDEDGRLCFVNDEACRVLEYTRDELLNLTIADFDPDYPEDRWPNMWEDLKTHQSLILEGRQKTKNGRILPVEINTNYIEYQGLSYDLALIRDITERKRADDALRRTNRELRAISDCNLAMIRAVDENALLNEICRIFHETVGYRLVSVGLAEHDPAKTLRIVAWAGIVDDWYIANSDISWDDNERGSGPMGMVFRSGKTICIQDMTIDPLVAPWREDALKQGFYATLILPLLDNNDQSFGILNIYAPEINAFSPNEIRLLEELAGNLAFGLMALRARNQLKQAEEDQRQLNRKLHAISSCNQALLRAVDEASLLKEVCRIICEDAGYRMAWVGYAENDAAKSVRPAAWAGFEDGYLFGASITWSGRDRRGRGPAGTAIRTGKTIYVRDFAMDPKFAPWRESATRRGYHSTIALPLKDGEGHTFGMLGIYSSQTNTITEEEIHLLEELAGDLSYGVTSLRSRAEHRRAEAKVRQLTQELEQRVVERTSELNAANKELEAFAYSVSHDLRAPLRHMDGFMELLKERTAGQLDAQSQHYMNVISDSARRMGTLIDDLLSFSRMGRYELSKMPVDIGALVREVIQELEPETRGRTIHWQIADIPPITGDRAMLKVVLVNLMTNALKFTSLRGQAEIEIGCQTDQPGEIILFVRDNGVGFDMKYADKLFGVFQRLHREDEFEGTGIGLANVRRVIARHGGRTWAEGEVDQGATFYFSLPQLNSPEI